MLPDISFYCKFGIAGYGRMEELMPVKYVFVTGGVVSGLGKGITAASLGRLLKARGFSVQCRNLTHISTLTREQ